MSEGLTAPKAAWLQQLDRIEAGQARLEVLLNRVLDLAAADDPDTQPFDLDGNPNGAARDESLPL